MTTGQNQSSSTQSSSDATLDEEDKKPILPFKFKRNPREVERPVLA